MNYYNCIFNKTKFFEPIRNHSLSDSDIKDLTITMTEKDLPLIKTLDICQNNTAYFKDGSNLALETFLTNYQIIN